MNKLLIAYVSLMVAFLFSCKTKNECKVIPPHRQVSVLLAGNNRNFNVWTGASESKPDPKYSLAISLKTSSRYDLLGAAAFYGLDISRDVEMTDLVSIVFYSKGSLDKEEITTEDILGALVYIGHFDKFTLQQYSFKNGEFIEITELESSSKYVSTSDIYLGSKVFNYFSNIVAFQISDRGKMGIKSSRKNNFKHNVEAYKETAKLGTLTTQGKRGKGHQLL